MDILSSAEAELAVIERKLSELQSLTQRRDQLRTFINIGRTLYAPPAGQESMLPPPAAATEVALPVSAVAKADTKKARIVEAAAALIAAKGPMQTRELLTQMEAQGIDIGGGNKIDTISVALSRSKDRFKSDRAAGGWMLI
jgi:hypothetical protein